MKKLFIRFNDIILPQNTQHQPTFGFAVVTQFGKITLKCLANAIVLIFQYRISRNSGRGSYHFVRQILPQNWVNAVLILGAVTINLV